ncbi:GtrA family protein [Halobacterium yunchengense]|uniref:GtrA family protein n=1 Tax=Halobacterium yunchengense TaxID=3108497 RepID=UPI00300A5F1B
MVGVVDAAERRVEALLRALGVQRVAARRRALRAVEFGAVGASGAVVNAVVFVLAPVAYLLAGALAFAGGTAWTFALNWTVTYDRPSRSLSRALARYASVYAVGFVVYSVVLAGGVELLHWPGLFANVTAIGVAGTVNFAGSELFALRP